LDRPYDVVAIGDSITQGFPFSEECSWVNIISKKYALKIGNRGICGDLTADMCNRFIRDVVRERPRVVIILGGYNDAFCGVPLEKVALNFRKMHDEARKHGIGTVMGLPTPVAFYNIESTLAEYRNWIRDYARAEGIGLIDFYNPFLDSSNGGPLPGLTVDGAHPGIEGYRVMAGAVDKEIFAPFTSKKGG